MAGHKFESDTDTEVIAKLIKHLHDEHPGHSFRKLVEAAINQLEGAFACCFKSAKFPGQCVATRRGSPLLVGIKTDTVLESDSIPVQYRYQCRRNIVNALRSAYSRIHYIYTVYTQFFN